MNHNNKPTDMKTIKEYSEIIEEALRALPMPSEPLGLYDPIRYALESGGKRLRPVLTLAVADALSGDCLKALDSALAIEIFHNFTLLHDDVMDHADMRRGRPTVHKKWDERTAILSGDTMLTLAYMKIAGLDGGIAKQSSEVFNRAAMDVYEGQQYDMDYESRNDVTEEEYLRMIYLKTSALIGGACSLGAIAGGATEDRIRLLKAYGDNLGMAFQLQDDYLDTYGDPAVFGKQIGGDILNDKKTWLRIKATEADSEGVIAGETARPSDPDTKIKRVREIYDSNRIANSCHALIISYATKAIDAIKGCGLKPEQEQFFIETAQRSCNRTH